MPYNILIINSDTYRYDNLFDRAAMPVATPNLDAFTERAVRCRGSTPAAFPPSPSAPT